MMETLRQHIHELVTLTDAEFARVIPHFTLKTYRKGQALIRVGEPVHYLYFVVSGLLKAVYTDESGKQHLLSFAMENWWESDLQAYFFRRPATLSLVCLEPTVVYGLTLDGYRTLCAEWPQMGHFFLQKANIGYISAQQRLLTVFTTHTAERYRQLLERYPTLGQRVSKTLLAAYLGVSREALSRLQR